jgi:hypothetical protein
MIITSEIRFCFFENRVLRRAEVPQRRSMRILEKIS